ncbi:MAG: RDD family protein [Verrucomicrobiales bacterium]|nr:RDD family protein [Verrucomicrobiales bacterium]
MNHYAKFWQRCGALFIDGLVFLPLMVFEGWLESHSRIVAFVLVIPMAAVFVGYSIYGHGRFGQTVGKHLMGIRVVRLTGERIGWREAWLRSSVEVVFTSLGVVGSFVALAAISDAHYYGVGWMQREQNLAAHEPGWLAWSGMATEIWMWSELVVMLLNEKRRSLHDFIAGTVVIAEGSSAVAETQPTEPCSPVRSSL